MNIKIYLYVLAVVAFLFGLSVFAPVSAHAAVLYSQNDFSVATSSPPPAYVSAPFTPTTSGQGFQAQIYFGVGTTPTGSAQVLVYNSAAAQVCTYGLSAGDLTLVNAGTPVLLSIDFEPQHGTFPCNLVTSDTYTVQLYVGGLSSDPRQVQTLGVSSAVPYFVLYDGPIPPASDNNTSTHVMRINDPALYSIVASSTPFDVSFDIYVNATTTQPNAYKIEYVNDLTAQYQTQLGYLVDAGWTSGTVEFTVATTTTLYTQGTWTMSVTLGVGSTLGVEGGPGPIDSFYSVGPTLGGHRFSVDFENNVSHVDFGGLVTGQFASTSCEVNFLGSDFDLGNCIGYLVQPASTTMANFSSLTLENSFPFAYAYDIGAMRDELFTEDQNGTTTVAVTVPGFGTITFLSKSMIAAVPFSATIKLILGALMWLLTAELVYLAIIRSHNTNTGV